MDKLFDVRQRFCKFDCPVKCNNNFDDILETIDENLEQADIDNFERDVCLDTLKESLEYNICDCCPLNNFIEALKDEKLIKEN